MTTARTREAPGREAPHQEVDGAEQRQRRARSLCSPLSIAMIALMAIGSAFMWVGSPIAWLWVASRISDTQQASIGPYMLVIVGVVGTAVALAKGLSALNRAHMRYTGLDTGRRQQRTWNRSMRDSTSPARDRGLLEPVMYWSVGIAMVAFLIWFFFFARMSF